MAKKERNYILQALELAKEAVDTGRERSVSRLKSREHQALRSSGFGGRLGGAGQARMGRADGLSVDPVGVTGTGDNDLDWLIGKESSGKVTAKNKKSSAFGLGQLIRGNRETYGRRLGIDPDTVDYGEQVSLMKEYIKERYGTAAKARAFWERNGWY